MSAPDELIAGRYRLVSRVGTGGMGVVWEAWDERLHRRVAVKQLHAQRGLSDAETELANLRAMREARITARLDHPHAVPVFDVVEHEGQPCLIMQFLPSTPLSTVLRERGILPIEETARIGAQIASALASAHRAGIVHRDVKPGNVLMAADGTARISDFGISHAHGDTTLTATGMVHGTPAYLAPEVARGADSTFASDVFGLGATLYTAREGAPPFGKDQNSIALLYRVASGSFTAPQRSGILTPLLLRMLAAEPAERPPMSEVAGSLTALATEAGAEPDTLKFADEADVTTRATPAPVAGLSWHRPTPAATPAPAPPLTELPAAGSASAVGSAAPINSPGSRGPEAGMHASDGSVSSDRVSGSSGSGGSGSGGAGPGGSGSGWSGSGGSGPARRAAVEPTRRRGRGLLWATLALAALLAVSAVGYALLPQLTRAGTAAGAGSPSSDRPSSAAGTAQPSESSPPPTTAAPTPTPSESTESSTPSASRSPSPSRSPSASASGSASASKPAGDEEESDDGDDNSADDNPSDDRGGNDRDDDPSAGALARAVTDYYDMMPRDTDEGWSRLTAGYQQGRAGGRSSYEGFWDSVASVSTSNARGRAPDRAEVTVTYVYKNGRRVTERASYRLVREGGVLKIRSSSVISSRG
jgi:serine/threonine protein kinase